jgi:hypothetical protein
MAIGMMAEFETMDEKKYDRINEMIDLYRNPPKGLILHTGGPGEKGWVVFDVWESQSQFDQFWKQKLQPVFNQLGITERPTTMRTYPVHAALAPEPARLNDLRAVGSTR